MIDPNIDGIVPNERLRDMCHDLRSSVGGGLSGTGPRGEGVFLVSGSFISEGDTRTAPKSAFANPTGKASYGIRIGDVVIFGETDVQTGKGQLCTGLVTAISNDVVTFTKHAEITTEGFSPTISVSEIEGGHRITIINDGGVITSFDVMDGEKGDDGDAFEFADFTDEQIRDLRSDIASVYYRKQESTVITESSPISRIDIPFADYRSTDIIFVDIEGLSLCQDIDYTIDGNQIVLVQPLAHDGVTIGFKRLIVVAMTQQDIDSIVSQAIVDDVATEIINRFSSDFPVATQETNGLMSSEDKTKLDSVNIVDRQTQTADYQRISVGERYADVALMDPNTGLINANNIPQITADKLADAVRKGYVRSFDTVVDMQAATDLQAGMVCHTNGFHASGDGGAAYYTVSASGTADGTNVIACGSLFAHFVTTTGLVSIDAFTGETNEDKLHEALNSVTSGIILCGEVTITKTYKALAKDYRKITIHGGTFNLTVNNFIDHTDATSGYAPTFDDCVILGNGHNMYVSTRNLVNPHFKNCYLNNVTVFNSSTNYIQSPYFIGCAMEAMTNLFTATRCYDMHMVGCAVAHSTGTLITVGSVGIQGGSISDSLIEVSSEVIISTGSCAGLSITNCYFENLSKGLIEQTDSSKYASIVVANNTFIGSMTGATHMCRFASTSRIHQVAIYSNEWRLGDGLYIANISLNDKSLLQTNSKLTDTSFGETGGFSTDDNGHRRAVFTKGRTATFDSDTGEIVITYNLPYSSNNFRALHPFYVYVTGNYDRVSSSRQGFAILRCCPYTYRDTIDDTPRTLIGIDVTVIDSRNYETATGTSTVTASGIVNDVGYTSTNISFEIRVSGFYGNLRNANYAIVDPFYMINIAYV